MSSYDPGNARGFPRDDGAGLSVAELGAALWERRMWIAAPVLVVTMVALAWVMTATPYYRSTAKVLIESQETGFTRPERSAAEARALDQEMVRSQEQLLLSVDLARNVIRRTSLDGKPEFAPAVSTLPERLLALVGITRDVGRESAADRLLGEYFDRLSVYQVDNSRVIAVEFVATDPQLAAEVANAVADAYIEMQRAAKRDTTIQASTWLGGQIEGLRQGVQDAERAVEDFRRTHGLFAAGGEASASRTITGQQLSELSSELATLRSQKSDAQARARTIHDMLENGGSLEFSDVLNSTVIQGLESDRARLQAQLAEMSESLGPRHPRIRQAGAEIGALDAQIRAEAEKIARSLENEARIAAEREEQLLANLDTLKVNTADSNDREVELRALQRDARAQRELLESMLERFGEASVRDTVAALPADARLISRALPAQKPYYPQKLPILLVAFLATGLLCMGFVVTLELMRQVARAEAVPHMPTEVALPRSGFAAGVDEETWYAPDGEAEAVGLAGIAESIADGLDADAPRTVLVTSVRQTDSLAEIALGLARQIAAAGGDGHRVVVVDTVFGEGLLESAIGHQDCGLGELLSGQGDFDTALVRDPYSRVHVIAAGEMPLYPTSVVSSERLELLLAALNQTYEAVVVLAPSIDSSADARLIARRAEIAVLVTTGYGGDRASLRAREGLHDAGVADVAVINLAGDPQGTAEPYDPSAGGDWDGGDARAA